uniref:(+)RNA virus helicase C-terminal domain-containing protein n=1 Tax=Wenling thamnaconus striatus hepevirus TaxID=2116400 RepID=A0A2P1GMP5_9VIRU|nr:hypothetical protein [Wenling thamnaconus striatus hepevirus]
MDAKSTHVDFKSQAALDAGAVLLPGRVLLAVKDAQMPAVVEPVGSSPGPPGLIVPLSVDGFVVVEDLGWVSGLTKEPLGVHLRKMTPANMVWVSTHRHLTCWKGKLAEKLARGETTHRPVGGVVTYVGCIPDDLGASQASVVIRVNPAAAIASYAVGEVSVTKRGLFSNYGSLKCSHVLADCGTMTGVRRTSFLHPLWTTPLVQCCVLVSQAVGRPFPGRDAVVVPDIVVRRDQRPLVVPTPLWNQVCGYLLSTNDQPSLAQVTSYVRARCSRVVINSVVVQEHVPLDDWELTRLVIAAAVFAARDRFARTQGTKFAYDRLSKEQSSWGFMACLWGNTPWVNPDTLCDAALSDVSVVSLNQVDCDAVVALELPRFATPESIVKKFREEMAERRRNPFKVFPKVLNRLEKKVKRKVASKDHDIEMQSIRRGSVCSTDSTTPLLQQMYLDDMSLFDCDLSDFSGNSILETEEFSGGEKSSQGSIDTELDIVIPPDLVSLESTDSRDRTNPLYEATPRLYERQRKVLDENLEEKTVQLDLLVHSSSTATDDSAFVKWDLSGTKARKRRKRKGMRFAGSDASSPLGLEVFSDTPPNTELVRPVAKKGMDVSSSDEEISWAQLVANTEKMPQASPPKEKKKEKRPKPCHKPVIVPGNLFHFSDCGKLVNAANASLRRGGGVCGQFYSRHPILDTWKPLPIKPGEAEEDPVGHIHAVAADIRKGQSKLLTAEAYRAAHDRGGRVFPLLGAGIFGGDAMFSVRSFLNLPSGTLVVPRDHHLWKDPSFLALPQIALNHACGEKEKKEPQIKKGRTGFPGFAGESITFSFKGANVARNAVEKGKRHGTFGSLNSDVFPLLSCSDPDPVDVCNVKGPPGTGKTFMTAEWIKDRKISAAVLTPTNKLCQDWRTRGLSAYTFPKIVQAVRACRVLVVDEGSLVPECDVAAVVAVLKPEKVLVLGDVNQIPYADRDGCHLDQKGVSYVVPQTAALTVTRRCPQDVTAFYQTINKWQTTSTVARSLIWNPAPTDFSGLKICAVQNTKKNGFAEHTVHEVQGATVAEAELVLHPADINLFLRSPGHLMVALTRHEEKLYINDPTGQGAIRLGISAAHIRDVIAAKNDWIFTDGAKHQDT